MPRARPVDQIEHIFHQLIQIFFVYVVNSRIDQSALAQRNGETYVNAIPWLESSIDPKTVHLRNISNGKPYSANQQDGIEQPPGHRALCVLRSEPIQST